MALPDQDGFIDDLHRSCLRATRCALSCLMRFSARASFPPSPSLQLSGPASHHPFPPSAPASRLPSIYSLLVSSSRFFTPRFSLLARYQPPPSPARAFWASLVCLPVAGQSITSHLSDPRRTADAYLVVLSGQMNQLMKDEGRAEAARRSSAAKSDSMSPPCSPSGSPRKEARRQSPSRDRQAREWELESMRSSIRAAERETADQIGEKEELLATVDILRAKLHAQVMKGTLPTCSKMRRGCPLHRRVCSRGKRLGCIDLQSLDCTAGPPHGSNSRPCLRWFSANHFCIRRTRGRSRTKDACCSMTSWSRSSTVWPKSSSSSLQMRQAASRAP